MNWVTRCLCVSSLAVAALAACAGEGTTSAPGIPAARQAPLAKAKLPVRVRVKIPKRRKREKYVSPATRSMTVVVAHGGTKIVNETVNLTPASPGCTGSLSGTLCTLTLTIGLGSYTATVTTYDGLNATGKQLSTAQGVGFNVVAGQPNTIPLTLDGIPRGITVFSAGNNAVYALATDADGNFIVGAGAPEITATDTSGLSVANIVQPTAAKPNLIRFTQATPAVVGNETIGITASYLNGTDGCAVQGAVCAAPSAVTITYGQPMLVANSSGNDVLGFTAPFTSAAQAPAITVPVTSPYAVTTDQNWNVFVASYQSAGAVYEFSPPYNAATTFNTSGLDFSYGIALDGSNNLYSANAFGASVTAYSPPYGVPAATVTTGISTPYAVTTDANGNLYVANAGDNTVTVYAGPSFSGTPLSVNTASKPDSLLIESGTLFVGEDDDVELFALPLTNDANPTVTLGTGVAHVYSMCVDASGDLFVANDAGGANGVGSIAEFAGPITSPVPPAVSIPYISSGNLGTYPFSLAIGPGGYLYVVDVEGGSNDGAIDEYALPLSNYSSPLVTLTSPYLNSPYYFAFGNPSFSVTP